MVLSITQLALLVAQLALTPSEEIAEAEANSPALSAPVAPSDESTAAADETSTSAAVDGSDSDESGGASSDLTPPSQEGNPTAEVAMSSTAPTPSTLSPQQASTANDEAPGPFDDHPVNPASISFRPGAGLHVRSKDDRFSIALRLRVQFRDELTSIQNANESDVTNRFGIRRARLVFEGNVFSKNISYKTEIALSPNDLGHTSNGTNRFTPLLDWYTEFTHLRDLSLRVGQYKLYYSRQRVISSGDLEFVDRNDAQTEFNLDRDIGLHLYSDDLFGLDLLRYYAGVSLAEGRDAWTQQPTENSEQSIQALGRIEILPFGDFDDYSEVDFERTDRFRLSLGGAYAYTRNATTPFGYRGSPFADGGSADYHQVTSDLMIKYLGFTLYSDFFWRDGQRNQSVAPGDEDGNLVRTGIGGSIQVGYLASFLPLGVGVRFGAVGLGNQRQEDTAITPTQELGGTIGWYIYGHPLKVQADYFHDWSNEGASDTGRVQLQVAY